MPVQKMSIIGPCSEDLLKRIHFKGPELLAFEFPPKSDPTMAQASALYGNLSGSIEIVHNNNFDLQEKIQLAVALAGSWGWNNVLKHITKIEVAVGCVATVLDTVTQWWTDFSRIRGLALWSDPEELCRLPVHLLKLQTSPVESLIGLADVPVQLGHFALGRLGGVFIGPKVILLHKEWLSNAQEEKVAWLIIHEALHHSLYPYIGNCITVNECLEAHRGIGVAWAINAKSIDAIDLESADVWSTETGVERESQYDYGEWSDPAHAPNLLWKVQGQPSEIEDRLGQVSSQLRDWGVGRWVDWACPDNHFVYDGRNLDLPDIPGVLFAGEPNVIWTYKFVMASLNCTVDRWTATGQLTKGTCVKEQAIRTGFAALMAKVGAIDKVIKKRG